MQKLASGEVEVEAPLTDEVQTNLAELCTDTYIGSLLCGDEFVDRPVDERSFRTLLHVLCDVAPGKADLGRVKLLLALGANPNLGDKDGVSPLMLAARQFNKDLVLLLVGSWDKCSDDCLNFKLKDPPAARGDASEAAVDKELVNALNQRLSTYVMPLSQRAKLQLKNKEGKRASDLIPSHEEGGPEALRYKNWFRDNFSAAALGDFQRMSISMSSGGGGGGAKQSVEDVLSEANLSGTYGNKVGGSQRGQQAVTQELKGMSVDQLQNKGEDYKQLVEARERMDVMGISD